MKRVPHDGRYAVYFSEYAIECISPRTSPDEAITSLFSFNGAVTSPEGGEASPGPVKSQDERVKLLRERGELLISNKMSIGLVDATFHANFTPDELYEQVAEYEVSEEQVRSWIDRERQEGRIIQPRLDQEEYRFA